MILQRVRNQPPEPAELDVLVQKTFGVNNYSAELIGEGAFAYVHLVHLPCEPRQIIVKWYKFPGFGKRESHQLDELRKHTTLKVPEQYFYYTESQDLPLEALVLEYIPGVPASECV